jgi:hypothetical protein
MFFFSFRLPDFRGGLAIIYSAPVCDEVTAKNSYIHEKHVQWFIAKPFDVARLAKEFRQGQKATTRP